MRTIIGFIVFGIAALVMIEDGYFLGIALLFLGLAILPE